MSSEEGKEQELLRKHHEYFSDSIYRHQQEELKFEMIFLGFKAFMFAIVIGILYFKGVLHD